MAFWLLYLLALALNIFYIREILRLLRSDDVQIEDEVAKGFWLAIILSLIPVLNMLANVLLLVFFIFLKWLWKKIDLTGDASFTDLLDDIFRIKPKGEEK